MTFADLFHDPVAFISTFSVSAIVGAIFGNYVIKTLISEKIRGQIRGEYDKDLAKLKFQLDQDLATTKSKLDKEVESHKAMLKSESDEKLEAYRSLLKSQSEIEIEYLKSRLSVDASRRQILFSNLQEKRATVIAEIHGLLMEVVGSLASFIIVEKILLNADSDKMHRTSEDVDERLRTFSKLSNEFDRYFNRNRIFIPKFTADKISLISGNLLLTSWSAQDAIGEAMRDPGERSKFLGSYNSITVSRDEITAELEEEFRILLGDEPSRKPSPQP